MTEGLLHTMLKAQRPPELMSFGKSETGSSERPRKNAAAYSRKDSSKGTSKWTSKEEDVFTLEKGWITDPSKLGAAQTDFRSSPSPSSPTAAPLAPRSTHKNLRVMAGSQGGRRLLSPADMDVRPMMEVVRGAVFSMLQALAGSPGGLPGGRWLDLFSGTGSVGIEALSRGCDVAHFVEADPWVVSTVLAPNLSACGFTSFSAIHTTRVENFLRRPPSARAPSASSPLLLPSLPQRVQAPAAGSGRVEVAAYDYISVTPPYAAVSYAELMQQLGESPALGSDTLLVVEYPLAAKQLMPRTCGQLALLRDRRYGRTNLAIYGPASLAESE